MLAIGGTSNQWFIQIENTNLNHSPLNSHIHVCTVNKLPLKASMGIPRPSAGAVKFLLAVYFTIKRFSDILTKKPAGFAFQNENTCPNELFTSMRTAKRYSESSSGYNISLPWCGLCAKQSKGGHGYSTCLWWMTSHVLCNVNQPYKSEKTVDERIFGTHTFHDFPQYFLKRKMSWSGLEFENGLFKN